MFRSTAWDEYLGWQAEGPKLLEKLNGLIEECRRDPFQGTGKPEPLRQTLTGWWSRRIIGEHRLVYRMRGSADAQALEVLSCRIGIESLGRPRAPAYPDRMAQVNVSFPDDLSAWAESRAAQRQVDPADYVRELVRRDREDEEQLARLQAAIGVGRTSGVSDRDPFEYLDALRARLRADARSADAA